jgi:UDP-N-acetylglucosamine/UDP-N-acetylgalactosamine diphosphorylase
MGTAECCSGSSTRAGSRGSKSAGILHIFYFQLDNPLVNVCDPVFLGHHIKNQCDVSSKVVRKAAPDERVGVFCNRDGALSVVEHCELSPEDRSSVEANGGLAFWAANTGTHLLSLDFLRRLRAEGVELPFHSVPQVTSCKSSRSRAACPSKPNSLRFVTYAFDVLPFAARASVIEVRPRGVLADQAPDGQLRLPRDGPS